MLCLPDLLSLCLRGRWYYLDKMNIDYLIIGQGISGTLLSYYLLREGKTVIVLDAADTVSSSKVAAGVINPVTGKRLVKTWMIDGLLPYATNAYKSIGYELGVELIRQCDILDFHMTQDAAGFFKEKAQHEKQYLREIEGDIEWSEFFRFNYGIGKIDPCFLVNIAALLIAWKGQLVKKNRFLQERFSWEDCAVAKDNIVYKGINAKKIILCNGATDSDDPYFGLLPWSKDKGEALIASIPGLPRNNIYKQGIHIVPLHDDLFWVGATHDWKYTDMQITPLFRKKTEEQLDYWLKLPYKIVDHIVAQRPTNVERKPFVGLHPAYPVVGIFNGMGTKGCSVAPYFANQFAQHLMYNTSLMPDVDIKRFARILSR